MLFPHGNGCSIPGFLQVEFIRVNRQFLLHHQLIKGFGSFMSDTASDGSWKKKEIENGDRKSP